MTETNNVIDKLATDLLKFVPTSGAEHTTINVLANLLKLSAPEIESAVSSKVDTGKLISGISKMEQSFELALQGGSEITEAFKGPSPAARDNGVDLSEHTEGNA